MTLRSATAGDVPEVAEIWFDGWRDGHEGHVPDELAAVRTHQSFRARAARRIDDTIVVTVDGDVAGFVMVVEAEIEQVYVARAHRGTGVAAELLAEAERRVAAGGFELSWLAVVAGNVRARRFYERSGWNDDGKIDYSAATANGAVSVPAHRYVKRVGAATPAPDAT